LQLQLSDHSKTLPGPPFRKGREQERVLDTARSYVGTIEKTNHNDGPVVEKFLSSVGRKKGDSWCAAFVSYCLQAGSVSFPLIRSGIARSFKLPGSIKAKDVLTGRYKILPGTIIVWEKGNTIFGHVGFVESWNGQSGITIEGNTSKDMAFHGDKSSVFTNANKNNADGVYRKNRFIQPANYFRITCFTQVTCSKDKIK
jgi:hypothetical protein